MRRRVLIALLAFGTLAGYSSGFASLHRWHRYGSPYAGCHHRPPPSNATPPAPQAQAPVPDAPAEPGPR
jgi:hypothetical protein